MAISTLLLDLETKSDVDLTKSGVYRYADSPYFDILLFAYSVDDSPVKVIDLASGESLPDDILHALTDDSVTKHSFNASFEGSLRNVGVVKSICKQKQTAAYQSSNHGISATGGFTSHGYSCRNRVSFVN